MNKEDIDTSKTCLTISIDDLSYLLQAAYEDDEADGSDEKFLFIATKAYFDKELNKSAP